MAATYIIIDDKCLVKGIFQPTDFGRNTRGRSRKIWKEGVQ